MHVRSTLIKIGGATLAGVLAVGVVSPAHAAGFRWALKASGTPNVVALAVDPSGAPITWAVGGAGVYRSPKQGKPFASLKFPDAHVTSIAIDPLFGGTAAVGTADDGVFLTTNAGKKFVQLAGSEAAPVRAVALDPNAPATIFAGTDAGVLRSSDNGQTWASKSTGLTDLRVLTLAFDGSVGPSNVFAGTASAGLFRSTSAAGGTWTAVNGGVITGAIDAVTVSPVHNVVYAGGANGLFRSTNGGTAWTNILATPNVNSIVIDPTDGTHDTLYATAGLGGLQKSTDGGATWSPLAAANLPVVVDSVVVDATGSVYAATPNGVFVSADGGATWSAQAIKGTYAAIADIAPLAKPSKAVYAVGDGGAYVSPKQGATWSGLSLTKGIAATALSSLVVSPTSSDTVYAGAASTGIYQYGVFESTDGGASWSGLANAPAHGADVLTIDGAGTIWSGGVDGVETSADGGATWAPQGTGLPGTIDVTSIVFDPTPGTIYLGDASGGGVFASTDGGTTWAAAPDAGLTDGHVASLIESGTSLLAGTPSGVFASTDDGATWTAQSTGLIDTRVQVLVVDPLTAGTVYAGTHAGGVSVSLDGGATWGPLSGNKGLTDLDVGSLAFGTGKIYAGTDRGVFVAKHA